MPCPCASGQSYASCCKPFHDGQPAPTAECLMRSRYAAYALKFSAYLLSTWHPSARPPTLDVDATCSGLISPDTHSGENGRHSEVSDEQATSFVYRRVQARGSSLGA
ncbi:MAG: YchJ family protein [Acidimicrobiia bacterium]